jgi:hypothetical protein
MTTSQRLKEMLAQIEQAEKALTNAETILSNLKQTIQADIEVEALFANTDEGEFPAITDKELEALFA